MDMNTSRWTAGTLSTQGQTDWLYGQTGEFVDANIFSMLNILESICCACWERPLSMHLGATFVIVKGIWNMFGLTSFSQTKLKMLSWISLFAQLHNFICPLRGQLSKNLNLNLNLTKLNLLGQRFKFKFKFLLNDPVTDGWNYVTVQIEKFNSAICAKISKQGDQASNIYTITGKQVIYKGTKHRSVNFVTKGLAYRALQQQILEITRWLSSPELSSSGGGTAS